MCIRYANLERKLGEVDRARAIYMFGGQEADPSTHQDYWATWHDFEINHGNEDTFREMLRIKRAVAAQYVQAKVVPPRPGGKREREEGAEDDPMAAADAATTVVGGARRAAATREEAGFTAAPTFEGARAGYVFTTAEFGTVSRAKLDHGAVLCPLYLPQPNFPDRHHHSTSDAATPLTPRFHQGYYRDGNAEVEDVQPREEEIEIDEGDEDEEITQVGGAIANPKMCGSPCRCYVPG